MLSEAELHIDTDTDTRGKSMKSGRRTRSQKVLLNLMEEQDHLSIIDQETKIKKTCLKISTQKGIKKDIGQQTRIQQIFMRVQVIVNLIYICTVINKKMLDINVYTINLLILSCAK